MAKLISLGTAVSASAAAAQTGVATKTTPMCRGFNAVVQLNSTGVTGTPTVLVQTSPDNANWTTAATMSVITRSGYRAEITLDNYARLNVSVAGSAGTIDCYLTE